MNYIVRREGEGKMGEELYVENVVDSLDWKDLETVGWFVVLLMVEEK